MARGWRSRTEQLPRARAVQRVPDRAADRADPRPGRRFCQETLGWDEARGVTYSQRSKEEAHDYRYFPEPDLPPLVVEKDWVERIAASLPELPSARAKRFAQQYGLSSADAALLASDRLVADYFDSAAASAAANGNGEAGVSPRMVANWITGEIFGWMNQTGQSFQDVHVSPEGLADLLRLAKQDINLNTAKSVLAEMLNTGKTAAQIMQERGLQQISDTDFIAGLVQKVLQDNPRELASYLAGKETLPNWFFGQVMRAAKGQANPQVLRS